MPGHAKATLAHADWNVYEAIAHWSVAIVKLRRAKRVKWKRIFVSARGTLPLSVGIGQPACEEDAIDEAGCADSAVGALSAVAGQPFHEPSSRHASHDA
jgi:hypothetical protein